MEDAVGLGGLEGVNAFLSFVNFGKVMVGINLWADWNR